MNRVPSLRGPVVRAPLGVSRLAAAVLLCASSLLTPAQAGEVEAQQYVQAANRALVGGDLQGASAAFQHAAEQGTAMAREYWLRAAETAAQVGDAERAQSLLQQVGSVAGDVTREQRVALVQARIALATQQPGQVLQLLPAGMVPQPQLAADFLLVRAVAQQQLGDPVSAASTLVRREPYLGRNGALIADNRQRIWDTLNARPLGEPAAMRLRTIDPVTRGWVELALATQSGNGSAEAEWQRRYPNHPAIAMLYVSRTQLSVPLTEELPIGAWAVLLPLSGPLGQSGEAVRDGLMAGYLGQPGPRPPIRFYDTGGDPGRAVEAYRRATGEGAALIIGPLSKPELASVISDPVVGAPILALNKVDGGAIGRVTQMALAPEDEASTAARRAVDAGLSRAVVLTPEGDWGSRVADAFSTAYKEAGGRVLAMQRYSARSADHNKAIEALLGLGDSMGRLGALTNVLGVKPQFQPQPRRDIDLIFLASTASNARMILPQLDFNRAGDLPIYATALMNTAEQNGATVRFCDMPWELDASGRWGAQRREDEAVLDSARRQPRLFAFGLDAYRVAHMWEHGELWSGATLPGATGLLTLEPDGSLARELDCGERIDGQLRLLAGATRPG